MNESILEVFKEYNITPLHGGGTNALYLLESSDKTLHVLKVAMLSNDKAKTEEICLNTLKQSKHVPRLILSRIIDSKACLLMEFIEGKTHLSTLLENQGNSNFKDSKSLFKSLGKLLAEIHQIDVERNLLSQLNYELPYKSFIDDNLYKQSLTVIKRLNDKILDFPVLIHGDFGYHNVIRDVNGRDVLIDWELASIGDPRVDIANLLFWTHLHFPEEANDYCGAFMDEYLRIKQCECTQEIMYSFVIFQVWRIIEMVTEEFPDQVKKEWNRRLSWALNKNFIA